VQTGERRFKAIRHTSSVDPSPAFARIAELSGPLGEGTRVVVAFGVNASRSKRHWTASAHDFWTAAAVAPA